MIILLIFCLSPKEYIMTKKSSNKKKSGLRRFLLFLFVFLLVLGCYFTYQFGYRGNHEPETTATSTNTDPLYPFDKFKHKLNKYKDLYRSAITYNKGERQNGTYVIPGLKSTKTLTNNKAKGPSICTSMTPQGIAVSKDYIFTSAYCHTGKHNSVVYMIDKVTHKFIKEIILPGKPHVGSISYDQQFDNLWVCGSHKDLAQANALSIESIRNYNFSDAHKPIKYLHENNLLEIPKSSFMSYFNEKLYLGYFNKTEDGLIKKYRIEDDGDIYKVKVKYGDTTGESGVAVDSATIFSAAQGMAFYKDKLFLTQSLGILPSNLALFQNREDTRNFKEDSSVDSFLFPSMLEQVCIYENDLYFIFESGAYAYRGRPGFSADRILKADISELNKIVEEEPKSE